MELEKRVERLERQNRIYRNLFMFAGLMAVALVAWGHAKPVPEVIQARRFEVRNNKGIKVVEIRATEQGGHIRTYADGVYTKSLTLGHDPQGNGQIIVHDVGGKPSILAAGDAMLVVKNHEGEDIAFLGEGKQNHGLLELYSAKGDFLVTATRYPEGGGVRVYNKAGYMVGEISADGAGAGALQVCQDKGDKCRAVGAGAK